MQLALLGLGNMGRNIALNLQDHGHEVHAWNRSVENRQLAQQEGLTNVYENIADAIAKLKGRKVVWMMVSAGEAVDKVLFENEDNLYNLLSEGDIIIDGVNSFFEDSKRRAQRLLEKGIIMLDCGVSGGVEGARQGACVMAGGNEEAFTYIEQIIKDMSQPDGYGYFGPSGAGHFVKMVHNGIEYGMMQAIAEGLNLIENSEFSQSSYTKLIDVWNNGSIIESNLLKFLYRALRDDPRLINIPAEVGSLGTGKWASEQAHERGVYAGAIDAAVTVRKQGKAEVKTESFLFKILQAMRAEFGKHDTGKY